MALAELRREATVVAPRIFSVPASEDHSLGDRAVRWCREHGIGLDPEQEMVLAASLNVREDGRWSAFEVGMNVPRQNGKGEVLMARELFGLFELGERYQVHSAHEFKTSERHFERLQSVIERSAPLLKRVKRTHTGRIVGFRYSHGDEAIELQDGERIEFRTRTKGGMRGFDDVSLIVLDEAMILSDAALSAMMPTVRASKAEHGPQIWYAGSAVDQEIHDHGFVWTRVRERGMSEDPSLFYAEWSLDFDHPDEVPDEVASDPDEWHKVNFAMAHGRVLPEHMEREFRSIARRGFVVELLGVGDYPATDGSHDTLITSEMWNDVRDEESVLVDPVCIAFDVSPDRRTSVAAAGLNEQGKLHVEVVASRPGTGWVAELLEGVYQRHEVVEVICDGFGPSASIAARIEEAGVKVRRANSGEYATACGLFVDAVGERTMRHIGQQDLDAAVRAARTRPLVDRWAWSRSKSVSDVGTLVASSLALWSADEKDFGNVVIF